MSTTFATPEPRFDIGDLVVSVKQCIISAESEPVAFPDDWLNVPAAAVVTPPSEALSTASTVTVNEIGPNTTELFQQALDFDLDRLAKTLVVNATEAGSEKTKKEKKKKRSKASTGEEGKSQKPKAASNNKKLTLSQQIGHGMVEHIRGRCPPRDESNLVDRLLELDSLDTPQDGRGAKNPRPLAQAESAGNVQSSSSTATTLPSLTNNQSPQAVAPSTTMSDDCTGPVEAPRTRMLAPKYRKAGAIFNLDDFEAMTALEDLFARYGTVSHMGILDKSYSYFVNKSRNGGLYFKVHDGVAIVGGDPLCPPHQYTAVLDEFRSYLKESRLKMAFMGASDVFMEYARTQKWASVQFGTERVLNPLTNPILLEQTGKRVLAQNRQLLNPDKCGTTIKVYIPSQGIDKALEQQLTGIYEAWRDDRDTTRAKSAQAFITVYTLFSLPHLMTYVYTCDADGIPNGFAALRKIGANGGYHIDPCIATPGAPRGITDLLVFAAMSLLNKASVDYLSFGFEPLAELGVVSGLGERREQMVRTVFSHTSRRLPLCGKKAYHDKFRPDESKGSGLHIIFPSGAPSPRYMLAMAHMANVSIRKMIMSEVRGSASVLGRWVSRRSSPAPDEKQPAAAAAVEPTEKVAESAS